MNINYNYISEYLNNLYIDEDFLIERNFALKNNIPIMKLETKEFIKTLLAIKKPKSILEIGTAIGYSSLIFSKYSRAKIITIEKSEKMANIALKNFSKYRVDINLIRMDAKEALNDINQGFDFVFIDANKSQYYSYFKKTINLIQDDGVIVCDNILFRGEVSNDNLVDRRSVTIVKNLRKFLSYITNLNEYETSIIPVGDGISVSTRRFNE